MNTLDHWAKTKERQAPLTLLVGDEVDVLVVLKGVAGGKDRVQRFSGRVIAMRGSGLNQMFTVRRLLHGEGVERTFPYHSPLIQQVKVKRHAKVRRAKLFYLRDRVGKAVRLAEKIRRAAPVVVEAADTGTRPDEGNGPDTESRAAEQES